MPISLILTPFDYFQIHPSFAVTPNLILEPCLNLTSLTSVPIASVSVGAAKQWWWSGNESWRVNHFPLSTGRGPAALGR